jgi:polysaccharide deacetylase family protein (PEP-CTERM system associated)
MENKPHAFTLSIDWEDFGQLLGRDRSGVLTPPLPVTIDRQTDIILEMLNQTGKKATFFILGMLAEHRADLVKKIAAEGHEIGLHGQNHINMRTLTREQAYTDLSDAHKLVTDIIGAPVYGFRAPYFSIDESNLFVLEILTELGLIYDSSIFPIKMKRYGIANFNRKDALYKLPNGKEIVELPLTLGEVNGKKVPVAGGGYIRAFPGFFLNKVFKKLNDKQEDVMLYMHPYEFDTHRIDASTNYPQDQSYSKAKTILINLRWNLFRNSIRGKLKSLLTKYEFITCLKKAEYVKSYSHSPGVLGRSE